MCSICSSGRHSGRACGPQAFGVGFKPLFEALFVWDKAPKNNLRGIRTRDQAKLPTSLTIGPVERNCAAGTALRDYDSYTGVV